MLDTVRTDFELFTVLVYMLKFWMSAFKTNFQETRTYAVLFGNMWKIGGFRFSKHSNILVFINS